MDAASFRVMGIICEEGTGRPVSGVIVRAFDEDYVFDDFLGECITDASGSFAIEFTELAFKEFIVDRPDLYLRVFDAGTRKELTNTRKRVRYASRTDEFFTLEIPPSKRPSRTTPPPAGAGRPSLECSAIDSFQSESIAHAPAPCAESIRNTKA